MTTLADIGLIVAVLATGLLYVLQQSNARLRGPDKAGAAIVYFLIAPFRWLGLAVALGVAIGEGGFDWISDSAAAQAILVYLIHIGAGVVSVILLATSGDGDAPGAVKLACGLVSYLFPLTVAAYAGFAIDPALAPWAGPALMRWILIGALALGAVAAAAAALASARETARRRAPAELPASPETDRTAQRVAELDATSPEAPLWQWLDFAGDNNPRAVQERALAAVVARRRLHAELAELLAGPWLIEALAFIRWKLQESPAALAMPVRDAVQRVAEHLRGRIEANETPYPGQFELEAGQAADLADRFHGPDADFRPALQATRDALDLVTGRPAAPENRRRLDAWLRRH